MTPYIIVIVFLGLAFVMTDANRPSLMPVACSIILAIFVGLRFEIGIDWLAYERLFIFVPSNFSLTEYSRSGSVLQTEFIFYALIVFVKSMGGSFELLLFVIGVFNIFVIDKMCRQISPNSQPFVWLVYFCLAIGTVQFNIIRQALASSFIILSLLFVARDRYWASIIAFALGFGIHTSVLMFLPVLLLSQFRINRLSVLGFLTLSIALFASGTFIGGTLLSAVAGILPSFIGSKAENYAQAFSSGTLFAISPLAMVLIVVYLYMLQVFMKEEDEPYVRIAIYLTLLVLFGHLALGSYPSFWNRIMCVSLPWQLATIWRLGFFDRIRPIERLPFKAAFSIVVLGVMTFQLFRPESLPFVPYHSLLQVWATGDRGDGRARAVDAIRQAEMEAQT